jgi:putative flippase GtrA
VTALRGALGEGVRYLGAAALALGVDLATYSGLIYIAGVHYLLAAPVGFALGLALIYLLSVRWVFAERRLANPRVEFTVFALIGLAGMGINELVIYAGVDRFAFGPVPAKLLSVALVFCFNFVSRKLLLFTRYS